MMKVRITVRRNKAIANLGVDVLFGRFDQKVEAAMASGIKIGFR